MQNYAKMLPKDRSDATMTDYPPAFPALATNVIENHTVSSVTALNPNTTIIEITAITTAAAIKWSNQSNLAASSSVFTAVGVANFDAFIPSGQTRRFVVPRSSQAQAPGSVVGLNVQEGLYTGIAMKSTVVGSVLLTQY